LGDVLLRERGNQLGARESTKLIGRHGDEVATYCSPEERATRVA
jgi:hypothetical protein